MSRTDNFTRMDEICIVHGPLRMGILIMKGTKRSELAENEFYFSMLIPPMKMQQLLSLYENTYNPDNQLVSRILELSAEKVKKMEINDFMETQFGGVYNCAVKFSDEILSPVAPSSGMLFTLISGGDVFVGDKCNKFLTGRRQVKDADIYDFKDIKKVSISKKNSELKKDEYEIWKQDFGPCLTAGMDIAINYERGGKKFYFGTPPEEMVDNAISKKLMKIKPELKKGFKEDKLLEKLNRVERYSDISLIDYVLKKGGIRTKEIYIDGQFSMGNANECALNYQKSFLNLEKNGKSEILEASQLQECSWD